MAGSQENYKFDLGIKVFPEIILTFSGFMIKILLHKCEKQFLTFLTDGIYRKSSDEIKMPYIPAHPISAEDAEHFLRSVEIFVKRDLLSSFSNNYLCAGRL